MHLPVSSQSYALFIGSICIILALDLLYAHRRPHTPSVKEALAWTSLWLGLTVAFNTGLYYYALDHFPLEAKRIAFEFLTGYIVEQSLSVDNLFVFLLIFRYLSIPSSLQHRVLFYGILGALVFRGIFVALGTVLMQYHVIVWIFGALLIYTGIKIFRNPHGHIDFHSNPWVKKLRQYLPLSPELAGRKFWIKQHGKWLATPLFLALALVEIADIIFAVDSVPAVFSITQDPFIVFTSNVFAILGLRSLYFLLAHVVDRVYYLSYGLATILIFVGIKMLVGHIPVTLSLGVILGILAITIGLSWYRAKKSPS